MTRHEPPIRSTPYEGANEPATDNREPSHLIYGGGPTCNPHCPGKWSEYHDGYADGYERDALIALARP